MVFGLVQPLILLVLKDYKAFKVHKGYKVLLVLRVLRGFKVLLVLKV